MVVRVAWRVHGPESGTFDGEDLAVFNGLLTLAGCVFVDGVGEVRVELEKVWYAARVVTMPMGEQYVREGYIA